MARKTENLQKHTLNLRAGDVDELARLFPRHQTSVLIRTLVSNFVDKVASSEPSSEINIKLDI